MQCCGNQGPWCLQQPRFLSLLSCLLGTQGGRRAGWLWDMQWGGGQGGQCTGRQQLTCLPCPPGGHRAALLHALHHAVDRCDRQEHLQAGDQEGPTLPGPRPATVLPEAPAQVPEYIYVPPLPQAPGVLPLMLGSKQSGSQGQVWPWEDVAGVWGCSVGVGASGGGRELGLEPGQQVWASVSVQCC